MTILLLNNIPKYKKLETHKTLLKKALTLQLS